MVNEEDEEISTSEPTCPWCKTVQSDYYEIENIYSEDTTAWECQSCGNPVNSTCYINYTFSSTKRDPETERLLEVAQKTKREEEIHQRLLEVKK